MIPYGKHEVTQDDIDSVVAVLKSAPLTQGDEVPFFEEELTKYTGGKFSVVTSSATAALHLTLLSMGVTHGDIVWTSGISFVASANCALYCGAKIDFVDIDLCTINISPRALDEKLKLASSRNELPKVLIVVHMTGQSCDMEEISELCSKYNIEIVEDASHAIGAKYKGHIVGSCKYSAATVFSFHPVKIITSAEGGAILTNRSEIFDRAQRLRSHGITKTNEQFEYRSHGDWYYEQIELGYNYRLNDVSASLVRSQLKRIDSYLNAREIIANTYEDFIDWTKYEKTNRKSYNASSNHLFVIRTKTKLAKRNSEIFSELRTAGIGVQKHYIPIYQHPYFKKLFGKDISLPNCEEYYAKCISIPIYPALSKQEQRYIIQTLNSIAVE